MPYKEIAAALEQEREQRGAVYTAPVVQALHVGSYCRPALPPTDKLGRQRWRGEHFSAVILNHGEWSIAEEGQDAEGWSWSTLANLSAVMRRLTVDANKLEA